MAKIMRIGIVGAGIRGCFVLGSAIVKQSGNLNLQITYICDINEGRISDALTHLDQECKAYGVAWPPIRTTTAYKELIDSSLVDLVVVTTHTDQHRGPAEYALHVGKRLYLDKPISVSLEDAEAIVSSAEEHKSSIVMGFTRRYESSWRKAKELLDSGVIGSLSMMQIRSIIPYTRYYQTWHRRTEMSGGALNDKVSHLLDVFNWMVKDSSCIFVSAVGGDSNIFPKYEERKGLRCINCKDGACSYRRVHKENSQNFTKVLELPSWREATDERSVPDYCIYAPGRDIIDHVSGNYVYENGVKACLFWAIYGPGTADEETLELVGSRGRIILERATGHVTVHTIDEGPYAVTTTTYDMRNNAFMGSHFGADTQLVSDIRAVFDGATIKDLGCASIDDGYRSLQMVLATEKSIGQDAAPVYLDKIKM